MFIVAIIWTAGGSTRCPVQGHAIVTMVNIYLGAYSYSIGLITWVAAGEIPSNRLRSLTLSLAIPITFLFAWLTTFTLLYFFNPQHLGCAPKIRWIWVPPMLSCYFGSSFSFQKLKAAPLKNVHTLTKILTNHQWINCLPITCLLGNSRDINVSVLRMQRKRKNLWKSMVLRHHDEQKGGNLAPV